MLAICASAMAVWPERAEAQREYPTHLRFEQWPVPAPGTDFVVTQYFEATMWFRPIPSLANPDPRSLARQGAAVPFCPDNGTPTFAVDGSAPLLFSYWFGNPFGLVSVDLAEFGGSATNPVTVNFTGYGADGRVVMNAFTLDGIIDDDGPLTDFETFYFTADFDNLLRVEVAQQYYVMDNLFIFNTIPEPSVPVLGAGGLAFLLAWRRRQTGT